MSLGQLAQQWQGTVPATITGQTYDLRMAFSNIDDQSPDGLMGDTEVEIEVRLEPE